MSARLTPALFRHAGLLLARLLAAKLPADQVVSTYFREHRQLGHADRGFIAEAVFAVLRRKRSLAARCAGDENPRRLLLAALGCLFGLNRRELDCVLSDAEGQWLARAKALAVSELPAAVRCDLPDWLYDALCAEYPADEVATIAVALNQPAPLDLRVNPLRGSRGQVLETLSAEGIKARACSYSPLGIRLAGKPAINRHRLFLDGSIEVQDEGSQLLGFLVQPRRGEMVADFCAGAGGKTLLLGGLMRSQGRVYAFDVAEWRLARLKARLARSGLSNVHPVLIDSEKDPRVGRLAGKLDRVLVDAPCSGLGTLRRNPDLKWRQSAASVVELGVRQRSILGAAARLVRAGGRLVYATCSLLDAENGQVVADFLAEHGDFQVVPAQQVLAVQGIEIDCGERLGLWPHRHGTDAFYATVMERR